MNLKILFSLIIVVLCGILGSNLKKKITGKIAVLREIASFLNFAQFQITMQANDLYMCIRNHIGRVKLLTPLFTHLLYEHRQQKTASLYSSAKAFFKQKNTLTEILEEDVRCMLLELFQKLEEADCELAKNALKCAETFVQSKLDDCMQHEMKKGSLLSKITILIGFLIVIVLI